jgi:hypothetical protein
VAAAYLNFNNMQQQKQIIEYWFQTNVFAAPMLVQIRMEQRDEAKAKELVEKMMHPIQATIIEKPVSGKVLKVNEVWEL